MFRNVLGVATLSVCMLLAGCATPPTAASSEPFQLEPLGQALPKSATRTALIDRIIASDSVVISSRKPLPKSAKSNDERVAEIRSELGFTLPDGYWVLYKQNLEALQFDLDHQHDAARAQYIEAYTDQLDRVDDSTLLAMTSEPKALDEKTRQQWASRMADRMMQYLLTSEASFKAATHAHINRMAAMDRQYDVCARKSKCWDQSAKK